MNIQAGAINQDRWVNPNIKDLLVQRYLLLDRCNNDLDFRHITLEMCRRDPNFWINNFVFTSDPRNASRGAPVTVPFVLFPKQQEYLKWRRDCLANRKWGLFGKSRDSGASWILASDHIHHWLFDSEYKGAIGSRKEQLVDRIGDPDSLFYKLRFIIDHLPHWMVPKRKFDSYMKLINEDNGSAITGEAGDSIGRGGRNLLYDVDEAAFITRQPLVIAALSQNTDCCIRTSTPNGNGDIFSRDYHSGNFEVFSFHWKSDPRKNYWVHPETGESGAGEGCPDGAIYPWYEEQKKKLDPITIAQEIDLDFNSSMVGVVIKHEWVLASVNYPLIMSKFGKTAGLDIATEGRDRSVLTIVDAGNKVIHIEAWSGQNTTQTAYKAIEICHAHGVDTLNFDCVGVGAGVAGTLATVSGLRFRVNPINGGSKPSEFYWVAEGRSSQDKFYNLRAEIYYLAAQRFFKTWENVNGIATHPTDECISIPNDPRLISQLSLTTAKYHEGGKLLLTSKKDMPTSPDFSDSLVYALIKPRLPGTFAVSKATW